MANDPYLLSEKETSAKKGRPVGQVRTEPEESPEQGRALPGRLSAEGRDILQLYCEDRNRKDQYDDLNRYAHRGNARNSFYRPV